MSDEAPARDVTDKQEDLREPAKQASSEAEGTSTKNMTHAEKEAAGTGWRAETHEIPKQVSASQARCACAAGRRNLSASARAQSIKTKALFPRY